MAKDKSEREAFAEGFAGVSREELEEMSDIELAQLHNGWNPEATRYILAEKEWTRRLAMRQLQEQFKLEEKVANTNRRWSIAAALIGVVGTLAGAVIGAKLQGGTPTGQTPTAQSFQSTTTVQGLQPSASAPTLSASSAIQGLRASQAAPNQ